MTRWGWVLLIFELFLFVVILIHPNVDLLDTAFRDAIPGSWPNCK
jgi:hypothetical protein